MFPRLEAGKKVTRLLTNLASVTYRTAGPVAVLRVWPEPFLIAMQPRNLCPILSLLASIPLGGPEEQNDFETWRLYKG